MNLGKLAFMRPHLWLGIISFVVAGSMVMQDDRNTRLITFIALMAVYQLTQIAFAWEHDALVKILAGNKTRPAVEPQLKEVE